LLFLKYLENLEQERATEAVLGGEKICADSRQGVPVGHLVDRMFIR
jgi:hypothetical protein